MSYEYGQWKPYVPVAKRRAEAARETAKLSKAGQAVQPVRIDGRKIAHSFWGKGWCTHLEAFSDFANRLPRGRTYVRNGSVCHLEIKAGGVEAKVMGSSMYRVSVEIRAFKPAAWSTLKQQCAGEIGSLLELLQGRLSTQVMKVVADRQAGLFPQPGEMKFSCSCPDGARMCKHVAAVLYGIGNRLDQQPQLLFLLRGVDAEELIAASLSAPQTVAAPGAGRLADSKLGAIFGIDLDDAADIEAAPKTVRKPATKAPPRRPAAAAPEPASEFRATAKTVAALRNKFGLSIAQFADRLAVSAASVQRWEAATGPLKLQARCLTALAKLQRISKC